MKRRNNQLSPVFLGLAAIGATSAAAAAQTILFDNGGFTTHVGQGANGADVSQVDSNFFGIGTLLSPTGGGTASRVAEDFEVTGAGWTIDRIRLFVYNQIQTGIPVPPAPWIAITMNIWDAHPEAPGSNIVATSTTLGDSEWTGVYRTEAGNLLQDIRPVYTVEAVFNELVLPVGTYWYDAQVTGGEAVAIYVKDGLLNADGNAMNLFSDTAGFNPIRYGNPQRGLAYPFQVLGPAGTSCYADCDGNETLNVDDFICFINAFAQSDPYADCDENGLFNIDDFLCFINAFATGCP